MGLGEWLTSKKGKTFMGYLYGIGAAVVIVGAMFKIQHWPGAGPMLILGLSTEAVIFFFSAFEPVHMDLDWSLVYPELAHNHDEEGTGEEHHGALAEGDKGTVTEQLDKMLEEAKIGPELIESLGAGLVGLKDQTAKLNQLTDASVATEEFVSNVKGASSSASQLSDTLTSSASELSNAYSQTAQNISKSGELISDTYSKTAEQISKSATETTEHLNKSAVETAEQLKTSASRLSESYIQSAESLKNELAASVENSGSYREQVQGITKNLATLNSTYELHLKEMNESMSTTNKLYDGIGQLLQNLNDSVDDTKRYKDGISELSKNLTALNTIYGNMLSAMSFKG